MLNQVICNFSISMGLIGRERTRFGRQWDLFEAKSKLTPLITLTYAINHCAATGDSSSLTTKTIGTVRRASTQILCPRP